MEKTKKVALGLCVVFGLALLIPRFILLVFFDDIPPPGQIVDVNGVSIHIFCKGPDTGVPVVIEAGRRAASPVYHWLVENLAITNRVCIWDRPGLGWSESDGIPDAEKTTSYLHAVLEEVGIQRPIILAGHSMGGLLIRVFQDKYPEEVAGLVFLDSSHPQIWKKLGGSVDEEVERANQDVGIFLRYKVISGISRLEGYLTGTGLDDVFTPEIGRQLVYVGSRWNLFQDVENELRSLKPNFARTAKTGHLGDLPILVISAGIQPPQKSLPPGVSAAKFQEVAEEAQADLASLSTNSKHVILENADHMGMIIMKDQAEEVASYIVGLSRRM